MVDFKIPDPNPALAALLTGEMGSLRTILVTQSERAQNLYRAKVAKKTGRLAASAHAYVEIRKVFRGQDRLVGVVQVGGTLPVGIWNSPRNPNPGGQFYYGLFHEFGTKTVFEAQGLSSSQGRLLAGLQALASDRAATPAEKRLARQHIKRLKSKLSSRSVQNHPAALDLQAVVREMAL